MTMIRNQDKEAFTLYIPIELKNRELASQVMLATHAAAYGIRTYIGSHASVHNLISGKATKAGIYLDKGTLPFNQMEWIKRQCEGLAILDQEMGPTYEDPYSFLSKWPGRIYPGTAHLIDKYFCVSKFVFEAAERYFLEEGLSNVAKLTGWPRIDLWRNHPSHSSLKAAKKLQKKYGEFLLYASSFGWLTEKAIEQDLKNAQKHKITNSQELQSLETLEAFRRTLVSLKNWDSNVNVPNIIIRPHISENKRAWKNGMKDVLKTKIVHKGSISDWILASNGVVHSGSTAAIEAHFRNKKVYYLNSGTSRVQLTLPYLMSDYIVDIENIPCIYNTNFVRIQSDESSELIRSRIEINDQSATEKIVEELLEMFTIKEKPVNRLNYNLTLLNLRKVRRMIGLLKWELMWGMGFTLSAPHSRNLGITIKKSEIRGVIDESAIKDSICLRSIGLNLWEVSLKEKY